MPNPDILYKLCVSRYVLSKLLKSAQFNVGIGSSLSNLRYPPPPCYLLSPKVDLYMLRHTTWC